MREYVLGFAFNESRSRVTMVVKNRPEWQAGKLNGVGGKVEKGEAYIDAMVREFQEEASVFVPPHRWSPLAILQGSDFTVAAFDTVLTQEERSELRAGTDEVLVDLLVETADFKKMVHSTAWLMMLALDPNMIAGKMAVPIFEYD